jgi:hypothetical protein
MDGRRGSKTSANAFFKVGQAQFTLKNEEIGLFSETEESLCPILDIVIAGRRLLIGPRTMSLQANHWAW